jgi:small-conductance mechanosensitive channel
MDTLKNYIESRGKISFFIICFVIIAYIRYSFAEGSLTFVLFFGFSGAILLSTFREDIFNTMGWIFIILTGFYQPGDLIRLGSIKGNVLNISVFKTTLAEVDGLSNKQTYTGRIVRIPNSIIFRNGGVNYSV